MSLSGKSVNYMEGLPYLGEGFEIKPEPGSKGYGELQAIDVNTGKKVWSHWTKMPWNGGVATTAGGLAFSGSLDGHLYAFDGATGKVLWQSPKLGERDHCSTVGVRSRREGVRCHSRRLRRREPNLGWADGEGCGEGATRRHAVRVRVQSRLMSRGCRDTLPGRQRGHAVAARHFPETRS